MKASIIVVNYNAQPYLESCLESLAANTKPPYEVLVIDNHSSDDSASFLRKKKDHRIKSIFNENNWGFAKACNQGLCEATGDLFITMNPDVIVPKNWLGRLVWHLEQNPRTLLVGPKGIGICGPQAPGLITFSQKLEAADRKFNIIHRQKSERTKFLIGCFLLFDHRLLRLIGFFDEGFPLGADDFDLSLRVRKAGYDLRVAKDLLIRHFIHASFNRSKPEECKDLAEASWNHFREKWAMELREKGWKRLFEDQAPAFPGEEPFPSKKL